MSVRIPFDSINSGDDAPSATDLVNYGLGEAYEMIRYVAENLPLIASVAEISDNIGDLSASLATLDEAYNASVAAGYTGTKIEWLQILGTSPRDGADGEDGADAELGSIPNGTVAQPSLAFTSNPATGIFLSDSGAVAVSINGIEIGRFAGDGLSVSSNLGVTGDITADNLNGYCYGMNTGDQTSIVGITGTSAQFNTSLSDDNFVFATEATAALALKAPLASPSFTGVPTAPSTASTDNSTKLATTAFVQAVVTDLIALAPGTLNTLDELANALGDDPNFATTVTTNLAGKLVKTANLSDVANVVTARANLGLTIGTHVQAYSANLTTWSNVVPGAGVASALAIAIGSAGGFIAFNGALGTPSSGNLVNCTFPTLNQSTTGNAATATALAGGGADRIKLDGIAVGATANSTNATLLARANHTGTQPIASILAANTSRFFGRITSGGGAGEELTGTQATGLLDLVVAAGAKGLMSGTDKTKLDGIAANAIANTRGTPDGTVALPAFAFASDPNTGIFSAGADKIGFSSGGTKVFEVNTTGVEIFGKLTLGSEVTTSAGTVTHTQGGINYLTVVDRSAQVGRPLIGLDFTNVHIQCLADVGPLLWRGQIYSRMTDGNAAIICDDEAPGLHNLSEFDVATQRVFLGGTLALEQSGANVTAADQVIGCIIPSGKHVESGGENPMPSYIAFVSAGAWSSASCPGDVVIGAVPPGSRLPARRLRIKGSGGIAVTGPVEATGPASASNLSGTNTGDEHPGYVAGRWYPAVLATQSVSGVAGNDVIGLIPFRVNRGVTISDLGCSVSTASAGHFVQLAIYGSDPATGLPTGTPLAATGNISVATTGGVSGDIVGANVTLAPGLYWMANNHSSSVSRLIGIIGTWNRTSWLIGSTSLTNIATNANSIAMLTVVQTFGTWPNLASASFGEFQGASPGGLVFLKAA